MSEDKHNNGHAQLPTTTNQSKDKIVKMNRQHYRKVSGGIVILCTAAQSKASRMRQNVENTPKENGGKLFPELTKIVEEK